MPVQLVNSNGSPTKAILIIWRSRVRNSPPAHRLFSKSPDLYNYKKLKILKNTGLTNEELNSILEDLETNGLMKTQQKPGLMGMKTELVPTDKGFKEYYS